MNRCVYKWTFFLGALLLFISSLHADLLAAAELKTDLSAVESTEGSDSNLVQTETKISELILDDSGLIKSVVFRTDYSSHSFWQGTVSGQVTDSETGEPLPGVNVAVAGTTTGTATDTNGEYNLQISVDNPVLIFSYIGYATQEVTVGERDEIDISLLQDTGLLDEVVVVGYGTMQKSSVTSSISKVENDILDQVPSGRPENVLAGRLAGLSVVNPRSTPGESPVIRIRGVGSIDAGNNPLVVIDGFPGGDLGQINMNDVESIEVLKDPSSAAIYGSRGAGGVILVTTKRGTDSGVQFNYNGYYGYSVPMLHDDWLLGDDWYEYLVKYQNREFAWAGGDTSIPMFGDPRRPTTYQINPLTYELPQTNWQDEITDIAPIQNHSISLSGGVNNVRYFVSGNFIEEDGIVRTANYKQYSLRSNLDVEVNDRINVGLNFNPSFTDRRIAGSAMHNLVKYPPFVPPSAEGINYPPRTQYYIPTGHSGQASPYVFLDGTHDNRETFRTQGQLFASIEPVDGLLIRSSVGTNLSFSYTDYFRGTLNDPGITTYEQDLRSRNINLLNENTLNYTTTLGEDHEINALIGASFQQSTSTGSQLRSELDSYNNEIIRTINNAIVNPANSSSSKSEWGLVSYFTRLNYSFRDKYLISAVFRTDGSSRFGSNNKWGNFPSLSVAWRLTEEEFMRGLTAVDELKLRASYGVTGNNNIGNYAYLGTVGTVLYSPNNTIGQGQVQNSFENPNLSWEQTTGIDIGTDISVFDNRFNLSIDYYDNETSDLLYNVSTPAHTGFTSTITNVGSVRNYGYEIELMTRNIVGNFNWRTSFNLSRNWNEVVDLGDVNERIHNHSWGMAWILRVGEPMFSYYGYRIQGIYQTEEQVAQSPSLPGAKPGNPIIADRNNDGRINEDDKEILGNFQPKATIGFVNDFSWRNFDLSIAAYASLGAKMYNAETQYYQGNTMGAMRRSVVENQWWSVDDPGDGMTPAAALSQLTSFNANTDYYIEDASYLSIRNVNLGYTLPARVTQWMGIRGVRIYTSINNLLMITSDDNYSYNPEGYTTGEIGGINSTPGFNGGAEPVNRVYSMGVNIDF